MCGHSGSLFAPARRFYAAKIRMPIEVIENHLADPRERNTLLLVTYGTLTLETCWRGERPTMYATRTKPGLGAWTGRAIPTESVEHARQTAGRLVRELGP